jgi:hypothetical protein
MSSILQLRYNAIAVAQLRRIFQVGSTSSELDRKIMLSAYGVVAQHTAT